MKEKKILHRLTAIVMVVALTFSSLLGLSAKASEGTPQQLDVGTYKGDKSEENWGAPQEAGKVFAGWFADEACTTPYLETTGQAYAKFVDAKVLSAKKQLSSAVHFGSQTADIRFLTAVDSIDYRHVNFKVTVTGNNPRQFDLEERKAYSSVLVDGVADPATAKDTFGTDDAKYFILHSITGIPNAAFGDTFTVDPYWCTLDGTIVHGTSQTFSINEILSAAIGEGEINGFDKAAGKNEFTSANAGLKAKEAITYLDAKTDNNGVTKSGVVEIDLSKENSPWPAIRFGAPLCRKPAEGTYNYVVFTMYVEDAPNNLVLDYKNQENNELLTSFPVKKGWAEYWVPLAYFDYDKVAAGTQFFVAYTDGNVIRQKLYIDDIRYANRAEAEVTETTAEYMNFGDGKSLEEFGTVAGNGYCTWLEEFQGAKGVIRMNQTTKWAAFKGLTPKMEKAAYASYGKGDYFIIKVYKANSEQNVTMYYKLDSNQKAIGVLKDGWNSLVIDASVVLDNWDAFAKDAEFFASLWNGDDLEITHDLYFDSMYFQKRSKGVQNDYYADFIDLTDGENWERYFATAGGQNNCSYDADKKAVHYQGSGPWPDFRGFSPIGEKADYEKFKEGKFVIEMDVASYSGGGQHPTLQFKDANNKNTQCAAIDHSGKYTVEIPASLILDNWDAFIKGEKSYFFFDADCVAININCYFTGMYFISNNAPNRVDFINFQDGTSLKNRFATVEGKDNCTYLAPTESGIHFTSTYGPWPGFGGFTPIGEKAAYEKFKDGNFVIEMDVASYQDQWGAYPKLYLKSNNVDTQYAVIDHTGKYTIKIPAAVVLDRWNEFLSGTDYFFLCDDGGNVSMECDFTGMYFEKGSDGAADYERENFIDFTKEVCQEQFATAAKDGTCTYVSAGENAVRYQATGEWLNLSGFVPDAKKAVCELLRGGKLIIEMDVVSYSRAYEDTYPTLNFKASDGTIDCVTIDHTGKYTVEIPASKILDNWDDVLDGKALFFFGQFGGQVSVDCKFTGMYFQAAATE